MLKTKALLIVGILLCVFQASFSQNYEKIIVNKQDSTSGYYLAIKPQSDQIKGVLVLLPGWGMAPETIFPESKLPNVAYINGILTIAWSMGGKLYADEPVVKKLNLILSDVINKYKVNKNQFAIGGFSAGGTVALRYVELCKEKPASFPVAPQAVFTVDSPVDVVDLWNYFEREIAKNFSQAGVGEAQFVSSVMAKEHGTPKTNLRGYLALTPFYKDSQEEGNEKYLKDVAVRVYHELDVSWQLKNRRRSAFDSNFLIASEMINRLLIAGNEKAEFVEGKTGYRSNGMRHPHSWSIVDEVELISWMKQQVK
jgi:hypothetical protein